MKTIDSLINEASLKQVLWSTMDDKDLEDRNKTREQAIRLQEYFEGRYDGLCDAKHLIAGEATCKAENEKLKALIKEAADYLDTNELTQISSSSILHKKFKEAV